MRVGGRLHRESYFCVYSHVTLSYFLRFVLGSKTTISYSVKIGTFNKLKMNALHSDCLPFSFMGNGSAWYENRLSPIEKCGGTRNGFIHKLKCENFILSEAVYKYQFCGATAMMASISMNPPDALMEEFISTYTSALRHRAFAPP